MEHREQPVDVVLHVMGGFHDVRFEQRINDRVLPGFMIHVMDF